MAAHGVPSGGDWALERFGAIFMTGVEDTSISQCLFERVEGNGVFLAGYTRGVVIEDK